MKQFRTALEFDSKEYEAWCQIVNDVYIGQDDPDLMISHIEDFVYRFEALVIKQGADGKFYKIWLEENRKYWNMKRHAIRLLKENREIKTALWQERKYRQQLKEWYEKRLRSKLLWIFDLYQTTRK